MLNLDIQDRSPYMSLFDKTDCYGIGIGKIN